MNQKKRFFLILVLVIAAALLFVTNRNDSRINAATPGDWAFEETFDGAPGTPSQDLLPRRFDYVATHRKDAGDVYVDHEYETFMADHSMDCAGPAPLNSTTQDTANQHSVHTSHLSNGTHPDETFFICKDHLMSSMGHVAGYSVTAFWPRQEFDFSNGGVLEFDTNINDEHSRSWWEVLIVPRERMRVGAAIEWLPIDETYPAKSIALRFTERSAREVIVSGNTDHLSDALVDATSCEWKQSWCVGQDPALLDRTIRRKHQIEISNNKIIWSVQKADGTFNSFETQIPGGLPLTRGLVIFKQHAYTPEKDGNMQRYTTHWDNIRFTGPVVGKYESFDADDVVRLQANGNRPIGNTDSVTVSLPHVGSNPKLFGQIETPIKGQVQLSINGSNFFEVYPDVDAAEQCIADGWHTFIMPIDPSLLRIGDNILTWKVGPRPDCANGAWEYNGYGVKAIEMQFDLDDSPSVTVVPTLTPSSTLVPTITPTRVPTNTPLPTVTNTPRPTPTPSLLPTPTPVANVFNIEYYDGINLSNYKGSGTTTSINYNWGTGSPNIAWLGNDTFSIRYSGNINFPAGTYRFTAGSDDGVRLKIDGKTVLDRWTDRSFRTNNADVNLTAGMHSVVLEYYENGGVAAVSLNWTKTN